MKSAASIGLCDVQAVYSGPEGDLWELVMGQQIHIGGLQSTLELAKKAGIGADQSGVDLCCCSGAGMRALAHFCGVKTMIGVDATPVVIDRGRRRSADEGLADRITFVQADACATGLPNDSADFVWGEDAWCYVVDKPRLIAEAARLVEPGGRIVFTDWIEGTAVFSEPEAQRFLAFMKFPNILTLGEYAKLLAEAGCDVLVAEDTGRFAAYADLYVNMLQMQLRYDALRIIGFQQQQMEMLAAELNFTRELAHAGKIAQGRLIARKRA